MGHVRRDPFSFRLRPNSSSVLPPLSRSTRSDSEPTCHDLSWPFGRLLADDVVWDDIRETAYEVFFTACRSTPGFGGRNPPAFYSSHRQEGDVGSPGSPNGSGSGRAVGVGMVTNSKIKRALGLRTLKRSSSRRGSSMGLGIGGLGTSPNRPGHGEGGGSPRVVAFTVPARTAGMGRRPLTAAEIMRLQMRVTEQSDNRLRKTLLRTLVGQMGRRAETIILPLELLRHLKPSEFNDHREYHFWQRRQLKILQLGLLLHPSIPLDTNPAAPKLRDILSNPLDTNKNCDSMKTLCNSVLSLAWRHPSGTCHWADGYPLNLHLYVALLLSVFDLKDPAAMLDEVDELMELIRKTWPVLGITRVLHNVCFTWVLLNQYVITGQTEVDLLCACSTMLVEVGTDAKRAGDRDNVYVKTLGWVLKSIIGCGEKKLLDYHEEFNRGNSLMMENLLPLVLQARKILDEDAAAAIVARQELGGEVKEEGSGNRVDFYIRSSLRNAFTKMAEKGNIGGMALEGEKEVSEALMDLAQATEELAATEKETYTHILKRWTSVAAAVAGVTLHGCYGSILNQYLTSISKLSNEAVKVLQRAGKLEKILVQMVVEDSCDCEDGGKAIVREMVPYEVDSFIMRLLRKWIEDRLKNARDCVLRAKETETWNPKSKQEPIAQSGVELMKVCKQIVDDFFQIPVGFSFDLVHDLANGLERVIRDYTTFVTSCGTKQSYIPSLPPLTRCHRSSKFSKLWKRASCNVGVYELQQNFPNEAHHPRPSTSRGTQRLYIRLNTLHYLLSQLNSLDKTLSLTPRVTSPSHKRYPNSRRNLGNSTSYFELAHASMQGAIQHVAEVAAYRLIFLDSNSVLYDNLYTFEVVNSRIRPTLRILKQNLTLMGATLIDRAQPLAVKEVMKATFEAFLLVSLAGGSTRSFSRSDYEMIEEDFESLKRVFCTSGVGLIAEDEVQKEAEVVEGVVELMGQSTEQLMEDFSTMACERSEMGVVATGKKLPMPPTTGRWNRSDPNTILRVLCHRNDKVANLFLKRTFHLPKRRS